MPQTLLGVLALALVTLLSFSQHRITMQTYEVRLRDEYSVAASGLLMQIMELAAARSYDEASSPEWIHTRQRLPTLEDFTEPSGFGGFQCDLLQPTNTPQCRTVDDLHGIEWQEADLETPGGHALRFEVSVVVEYVNDLDPTQVVLTPTHSKRVTLTVRSPDRPTLARLVELERVITYDRVKAEAEYEMIHGPLTGS